MATKYHQISLNEVFSDCQTKLIEEAPSLSYSFSSSSLYLWYSKYHPLTGAFPIPKTKFIKIRKWLSPFFYFNTMFYEKNINQKFRPLLGFFLFLYKLIFFHILVNVFVPSRGFLFFYHDLSCGCCSVLWLSQSLDHLLLSHVIITIRIPYRTAAISTAVLHSKYNFITFFFIYLYIIFHVSYSS